MPNPFSIYTIPKENTTTENIGNALSQGLQQLAHTKMQDIQQQKAIKQGSQFWQALGLPEQVAMQFASAPEGVQKSLLDRLEGVNVGGMQGGQQYQNESADQQGLKIGANPAERRHKEAQLLKKQIHEDNKLFKQKTQFDNQIKPLRDEIHENEVWLEDTQLEKKLKEGLDILKSGKAASGVSGIPSSLSKLPIIGDAAMPFVSAASSDETNYLRTLYDTLASIEAGNYGGPMTQGKISLAKSTKPLLTESRAVQIKKVKDYIQKIEDMKKRGNAFKAASEKYTGYDLNKFNKIYDNYLKKTKSKSIDKPKIIKAHDKYWEVTESGRREISEKEAMRKLGV